MALSYISQSYIGFVAVINEIYAQTIFIESNAWKNRPEMHINIIHII